MFYVMRVKFVKDGTTKKSEVMDYETRNEAMAKFHTNLGTDMSDSTLSGSMCTVINSHGGQEAHEYWGETDIDKPVDVPEDNDESEDESEG